MLIRHQKHVSESQWLTEENISKIIGTKGILRSEYSSFSYEAGGVLDVDEPGEHQTVQDGEAQEEVETPKTPETELIRDLFFKLMSLSLV